MHETLAIIVDNRVTNCVLRAVGDPWEPAGVWRVAPVGIGPGDLFDPVTETFSKRVAVYDPTADIAAAWTAADEHANEIDANARFRYLAWLIDPTSSLDRRAKIRDNLAWADLIWRQYATIKADCMGGTLSTYDPKVLGSPPHTFWEVAAS